MPLKTCFMRFHLRKKKMGRKERYELKAAILKLRRATKKLRKTLKKIEKGKDDERKAEI